MFHEALPFEDGGVVYLFYASVHPSWLCSQEGDPVSSNREAGFSTCACESVCVFRALLSGGGGQGSHKKFNTSVCIVVEITNVTI